MNQQLVEQNRQLNDKLQKIAQQLTERNAADSTKPADASAMVPDVVLAPRPGAPAEGSVGMTDSSGSDGSPPNAAGSSDPNAIDAAPSVSSAYGGGDLMASPNNALPDLNPGGDVNEIGPTPSRLSAYGGGDLISFGADDSTGINMNARFGRLFTNNGLWFESPNKMFQFHIGGRTQMDSSFFSTSNAVQFGPNGIGKLRDGVDPRRMRIRIEGAMYENTMFCMEWDFINSSIPQGTPGAGPLTSVSNTPAAGIPVPLDLWIGFRRLPYIGNIRIGNQKEPIGFERLESSRFLNFMERSFNQDAFYAPYDNGFVPGIAAFSTLFDRRMTWAAGVYKNVTNPWAYDVGGGNYKVTGRLTALLLDEDKGRQMMHLGISGRESGYDNGQAKFRVRGPERAGLSTVWPLYANTGVFNGRGGQQDLNLESANVFGPWTIDAEYNFHFSQNAFLPGRPSVGTLFYSGGYVEVLYFLTGEHRAYVREAGSYDRVVPKRNAYWVKVKGDNNTPNEFGHGAWQLGVRYNYLNLNDKGIDGGILSDITMGLNWFINPNAKFQWNYSVTDRRSPGGQSSGLIQGFGMRYAMDY
jgi:phosphate-selective porin OprO/OprP